VTSSKWDDRKDVRSTDVQMGRGSWELRPPERTFDKRSVDLRIAAMGDEKVRVLDVNRRNDPLNVERDSDSRHDDSDDTSKRSYSDPKKTTLPSGKSSSSSSSSGNYNKDWKDSNQDRRDTNKDWKESTNKDPRKDRR
jgi:hypothetical protein